MSEDGVISGPESDWLWDAGSRPTDDPALALALETIERAHWLDDDPDDE